MIVVVMGSRVCFVTRRFNVEISGFCYITAFYVLCAWDICYIISFIAFTFRENWDFVFIIIVQYMMSANSRIRFGMQMVFVCLYITPSHYHHCANLSEDIEFLKCLSDIFCRVCEWDQAYFLSYPLYNIQGCFFFSFPFSLVMIERIYTLLYYHDQIGSMTYYPLFRFRSQTCYALYVSIFLCKSLQPWSLQYHYNSDRLDTSTCMGRLESVFSILFCMHQLLTTYFHVYLCMFI